MFNRKKEKAQALEIDTLKQQFESALRVANQVIEIKRTLQIINAKVIPTPVVNTTVTLDGVEFAKQLQGFTKRRSCGGGSCGFKYEIPCDVIDSIANKTPDA